MNVSRDETLYIKFVTLHLFLLNFIGQSIFLRLTNDSLHLLISEEECERSFS